MAEVLNVESRDQIGTTASRRLRNSGRVPAVLYGHGQDTTHLSISERDVKALLRHHSKTVTLAGDVQDTALVRDVQFDPLGIEVLHLDLLRVNLKESVEVTVPVRLQGDAPGVREGGMLLENLHEVQVRCSAGAIPEEAVLNVSDLHVGGSLSAGDLDLPEGVELVTPADSMVAHVEEPKGSKSVEVADGPTEPEVIAKGGDKSEEEEG
ncbi:MAG: 50S ribosomal protein L25 [Rubripirellula sp.]|jgi:large subunit ribosomal protein L25